MCKSARTETPLIDLTLSGQNQSFTIGQNALSRIVIFVKHLDFSKHIDAISAKFDAWTNGTSKLEGAFWALDKALSVVNIAVQGLAAGLSTVMGLLQEAGNGLQGLAAVVGNSFGQITDWLGITENAAHQFDETLQRSFDRVGDGLQNAAQSVKANQDSILDSARNILGIQQEQAEVADQATKSLDNQKGAVDSLTEAQSEHKALLQDMEKVEEDLARSREQASQSALKNAQAQAEALERSKSALSAAGLDFDELLTGVSSKTKQTFENYTTAVYDAMQAGANSTQIARAGFEKLAASIDSPQAWQARCQPRTQQV